MDSTVRTTEQGGGSDMLESLIPMMTLIKDAGNFFLPPDSSQLHAEKKIIFQLMYFIYITYNTSSNISLKYTHDH